MAHDKEMGVLKPLEAGASVDHNHDNRYYTSNEVDTKLSKKSNTGHAHSEYALTGHSHSIHALVDHDHDDRYALLDHTHSEYAAEGHTHSGYAKTNHTHDYTTIEAVRRLLDAMIPTGTVIFGAKPSLPGTWTQITDYRYVRIYSSNGVGPDAGLPNITGSFETDDNINAIRDTNLTGAFTKTGLSSGNINENGTSGTPTLLTFNASKSNSIYGNSTTVTPDTYNLTAWKKTAYEYS